MYIMYSVYIWFSNPPLYVKSVYLMYVSVKPSVGKNQWKTTFLSEVAFAFHWTNPVVVRVYLSVV